MAGNITGSMNSTATLDGVTGVNPIAPNGSLVVKSAPTVLPVAVAFSTTYAKTSDTIADFAGLTGSTFANGNLVAIFWTGGYCLDGLVSAADATAFKVTFSDLVLAGGATAQTVLPASSTAVKVSLLTQTTDVVIDGTDVDQIIMTSSQPGAIMLYDDTGTPVCRRISVITSNNGFDGFPNVVGQTLTQWTGGDWVDENIVTINFYNNSTSLAAAQVVALMN